MPGVKGEHCLDVWKSLCPKFGLHLDAFWCSCLGQNPDNHIAVTLSSHPQLCDCRACASRTMRSLCGVSSLGLCHQVLVHAQLTFFFILSSFLLLFPPKAEAGTHVQVNSFTMIIADVIILCLITLNIDTVLYHQPYSHSSSWGVACLTASLLLVGVLLFFLIYIEQLTR